MKFNYPGNLKTMTQARVPAPLADRLAPILLQIVDGGLAGVIFLVPFAMGGRHPLGQLILAALAVVSALAWALYRTLSPHPSWRPTWALALLAAAVALVVVQVLPLPPSLLDQLAPRNARLLPLWNAAQTGSAPLGRWAFVSFTPGDTLGALPLLASYGLLFFVAAERVKTIEDVERLLRWSAVSAVCMAAFALVQYVAGNGKFFWFYTHPFATTLDGAKGSFTNKNHFAFFLALGAGPLVWWLMSASRRTQQSSRRPGVNAWVKSENPVGCRQIDIPPANAAFSSDSKAELRVYVVALALAIVLFAGLMSLSRGGMAAILLAATVAALLCCRGAPGGGKFLGVLLAACVLIGAALSVFGLDQVGRRLETLTAAELENDRTGGRLAIWANAAKAIPDRLWLGTGLDSFPEVYPAYAGSVLSEFSEFTHAENSYLQVLLETGAIGLALAIAGIVLWITWCVRGWKGPPRLKTCAGAIAGSLAAATTHALVDFVWYVPACMALVAILAACAFRIRQFAAAKSHPVHSRPLPRLVPAALALALLPAGGWMILNRLGPAAAQPYWEQYLIALNSPTVDPLRADGADLGAQRGELDAAVQRENKLIACLEKTLYWRPDHARAELALAEAHLRLFDKLQSVSENPMTLANIRDAALASNFSSQQALCQWLARAIGDNRSHLYAALRHVRNALSLCPLQGRGYVYLAKLCFLDETGKLSVQACIDQALRVRPLDGAVIYAAAAEALLAGDDRRWLELSMRAFRCGRTCRRRLIADFLSNTPPEAVHEMADFIVTRFQPDLDDLQFLYASCSKRVAADQLAPLCRYQAQQAEAEAARAAPRQAAALWLEAQRLHTQLKDGDRALQCARSALRCDPSSYRAHWQLALCLMAEGLYADAESNLHWCLQRNPRDRAVENKIKEALRARLDAERMSGANRTNTF